jgi:hypothetical protein
MRTDDVWSHDTSFASDYVGSVRPDHSCKSQRDARKRYGFDQDTRNLLDGLGINQDRLAEPDFDLQTYLMGRNLKMALEKAIETEEGRELLSEASKYEPGSPELRHLHGVLLEHFGDPRIGRFLQYLEGLPSR